MYSFNSRGNEVGQNRERKTLTRVKSPRQQQLMATNNNNGYHNGNLNRNQFVAKPPHVVYHGSTNNLQDTIFNNNLYKIGTAHLEMKPKVKQSKLLSSKSLSQLVPRGLFFKRSKHSRVESSKGPSQGSNDANDDGGNKSSQDALTTTKSLPNCRKYHNNTTDEQQPQARQISFINRLNSGSLLNLPRQSSSNSFHRNNSQNINSAMEHANFSPIQVAAELNREANEPNQPEPMEICESDYAKEPSASQKSGSNNEQGNQKQKTFKPFKNTKLVLRDVKNSIGLRIKANHNSQAFSKLTNEIATPPTKLYSPFNIYLDGSKRKERRSNADNNLDSSFNLMNNSQQQADCSMSGGNSLVDNESLETPAKRRIVLRHKKHLIQETNNSKFKLDSPTGRFKETVKDVEQFQQCIEDISRALRARSACSPK